MALSAALSGVSVNFVSLFFAIAIFGIGGSMTSISIYKLIASLFTRQELRTATGLEGTGTSVGSIVSLMITNSVVLPLVGTWRNVFFTYSLFGYLVAVVWLLLGRRSRQKPRVISDAPERAGTLDAMKSLLRLRDVQMILIINFVSFLVSHGLPGWLPTILQLNGMSPAQAGFIASIYPIFGVIGNSIIPRASYRLRSKKMMFSLILFIYGMGAFLVTGMLGGSVLIVGIMISGFFSASLGSLIVSAFMEMPEVGVRYMGAVSGIYFTFGEVGGFLGPFLLGYIKDLTGSFYMGLVFITAMTELMILPATFIKKKKDKS